DDLVHGTRCDWRGTAQTVRHVPPYRRRTLDSSRRVAGGDRPRRRLLTIRKRGREGNVEVVERSAHFFEQDIVGRTTLARPGEDRFKARGFRNPAAPNIDLMNERTDV